jgi:hypothetical protein
MWSRFVRFFHLLYFKFIGVYQMDVILDSMMWYSMHCDRILMSGYSIWLIDWLFTVLRPAQEFFTYMVTSPLPAYARRWRPLSREGSLSCHTYCDTGPRFFRSHPKDHPIQSPLTTRMGMRRTYSNPDPHGMVYNMYFRDRVIWDSMTCVRNLMSGYTESSSKIGRHEVPCKLGWHEIPWHVSGISCQGIQHNH